MEVPAHLRNAVAKDGLWVFAYGSLMWRPNFPVARSEPARLYGYHRALCIYSTQYRGTYQRPGLVFGLDAGGSCRGLALNAAPAEVDAVMAYLYEREMITRVYKPKWLTVHTPAGPLTAWVFVTDRAHVQYTGKLPLDEQVKLVRQGRGKQGPCIEYLKSTLNHLREQGIRDAALERVVSEAAGADARHDPKVRR